MPDVDAYPLYRAVVEGFEALGAANPQAIRRAVVYRSLTFVGQQFQCEGRRAVWLAGEETAAADPHGTRPTAGKLEMDRRGRQTGGTKLGRADSHETERAVSDCR